MEKRVIKSRIEQVLASQENVKFAYLFGSQAKCTAGVLSDIDIAVVYYETNCVKDNSYGFESDLVVELEKALEANRVDLVVLNNAPIFLRY